MRIQIKLKDYLETSTFESTSSVTHTVSINKSDHTDKWKALFEIAINSYNPDPIDVLNNKNIGKYLVF